MKRLLPIFIVIVSLLAACGRRVKVTGKVTHSENGRSIQGAWVYDSTLDTLNIESPSDNKIKPLDGIQPNKQIVTTDEEGNYVLENISMRKHFIYVAAEDFEWVKVKFKPKGRDSIVELDIELEPKPIEIIF